jgi:type II secretory pathway pseudopilin PulG
MLRPSKLATWQVLAILVITLGVFGPSALQAKQKQNEGCQQKTCQAPVLEKPTVAAPCCPAPVVREKSCAPPPAPSCCPVDPKDVHKAEKANEHAQHEAAEACKRQQRAAQKAQQRIDDAYAHGNHEIDEATAKVNKRYSEWQDEYAKLNSLTGPSEATAETQPQPESEIRTKPEPIPEATPEPPTPPQVTPAPAPEVTPTPAPEVAPSAPMPESKQEKPKELPKTASPLELFGLVGLLSSAGSYMIGSYRR